MWVETNTYINLFSGKLQLKEKESWISLKFLLYSLVSVTNDLQLIK